MIKMLVHDIMQIQLGGQSQTPNPKPQAELSEPLRTLSPPIGTTQTTPTPTPNIYSGALHILARSFVTCLGTSNLKMSEGGCGGGLCGPYLYR